MMHWSNLIFKDDRPTSELFYDENHVIQRRILYSHDYLCNCKNTEPIGSERCHCRLGMDLKAFRNGTFDKPYPAPEFKELFHI